MNEGYFFRDFLGLGLGLGRCGSRFGMRVVFCFVKLRRLSWICGLIWCASVCVKNMSLFLFLFEVFFFTLWGF